MARNAEKAMAMMSRWTAMQKEEGKVKERRPYLATECSDLPKAEKWRRQIIGEVSKKVAQIQNAGLGEFRIRDLNDEINKLLREKRHWEDRILELGGPDYKRIGPKMLDHEGKEVPGNRGYKYFGAAKDLPGVRELFEQEPPAPPRKTRGELMRNIDADYYGYRDEDDGVLVPLEKEAQKEALERALEDYEKRKEAGEIPDVEEVDIYATAAETAMDGSLGSNGSNTGERTLPGFRSPKDSDDDEDNEGQDEMNFVSHVPVPTQEEVEALLVQRKKMELLEKYASETLMQQSQDAKTLLGLE